MWFREVVLPAVTRAPKAPHATAFLLTMSALLLLPGGPALAGAVGQGSDSQGIQSPAPPVAGPAIDELYSPVERPAATQRDGLLALPAVTLAESVTPAPRPAVARFADDGYRPSLLETATPPVPQTSLMIPTVQAFAAATGSDLGRRMIFDAPDTDQSESPQQLIPLPPAGWTGMMGLVSLGVVGKLRRLRRRF
jgi:hypothetical protein